MNRDRAAGRAPRDPVAIRNLAALGIVLDGDGYGAAAIVNGKSLDRRSDSDNIRGNERQFQKWLSGGGGRCGVAHRDVNVWNTLLQVRASRPKRDAERDAAGVSSPCGRSQKTQGQDGGQKPQNGSYEAFGHDCSRFSKRSWHDLAARNQQKLNIQGYNFKN